MFKTDSAIEPQAQPENPKAKVTRSSLSRRGLFGLAGASAALAASPSVARGFGSGFTHSVASGEPSAKGVLLWTRFVADQDVMLEWAISETADMNTIVEEGVASTGASKDWCVKGYAYELEPDTWYFYQFTAPDGTQSPVGRTRTLPEGPTSRFRMAVFSCANYGFGWFNAYAHAAEANDCDLAVHLGDYIYEYGGGTYPAPDQKHPNRDFEPANEIVTLADYRLRYATYRADPDLQRLHQVMPMIMVWDDHESANDSWKDGAQNHQPESEGSWEARKATAKRVYREWMPISDEPYASYDVGDLATLFRIDTRLEGREEQFSVAKVIKGETDPEVMAASLKKFAEGDYLDPERQILGASQEEWLTAGLASSRARGATWQVLVQQVLIGKVDAPRSLFGAIPDNLPEYLQRRLQASSLARAAGLPLNFDAWDGYPAARDRLFKAALEADANLVVLAGDTHNAWNFDLMQDGAPVGVEFATSSVSSPGFESYLGMVPPKVLAAAVIAENSELQWADTAQRGYMVVDLTPQTATSEWRFTAGIKERSTKLAGAHSASVAAGAKVQGG
ncbi:MAG: alkaline phosphatase D family protein [Pseudomonadota bacterium]